MVGEGAKVLVRRALADWHGEPAKEHLDRYLAYYQEVCLDTTVAYPGIEAMLAELAPTFRMAVLSNKGERLSIEILEGLDLAWRFKEILGGDSLPTRKPNPAGLNALADRLDVPVERLLLIGDSRIDAETARNAGCAFALVGWGFPPTPGRKGWRPTSKPRPRKSWRGSSWTVRQLVRKSISQKFSVPVSAEARSRTRSFHAPLMALPVNAESACAGAVRSA